MELSASFADETTAAERIESDGKKYEVVTSPIGHVYIPLDEIELGAEPGIRYEKHPWIERFEFDGMLPRVPRRTGYGTKNALQFVESLGNIYAGAYDDCGEYGYDPLDRQKSWDIEGYFRHISEEFIASLQDPGREKIYRLFCGWVENLWREGTQEMHDIAMTVVLPIIESVPAAGRMFYEHITAEFTEYIREHNLNR